jgi:NTP pyrophosphatase (non-canonical NTP hydrolase)
VKGMWKRFMMWAREWAEFPGKAREYREYLREHDQARVKFNKLAGQLGYLGHDYLDAAIKIALRCQGSETALKRIAISIEAEEAVKDIPGLSAAEIERLAILAEECGEVVQAVGKVLRHGWDSQSPYGGKPNRVALEREIGNVRAVVNLMLDAGDVRLRDVQSWQRCKRLALPRWTHHQEDSMPRDQQLAMMRAIESERLTR